VRQTLAQLAAHQGEDDDGGSSAAFSTIASICSALRVKET
jgi:hypothetical protein